MSSKPRYFPISPKPLKMSAGLSRFGTDFGQAERDQQFFQLDTERGRYLTEKRAAPSTRRVLSDVDPNANHAREAALLWMRSTLQLESPQVLAEAARDSGARDELDALARALQEDFCVMCAGAGFAGSAALIDVRFPSGWRPERLAGSDFRHIHAPVPGFPGSAKAAQSMVRTMIERGPFVRFVWTLAPEDRLDQHPDVRSRAGWDAASAVWLRVERQITVPLTAAQSSLFLIRVHHYRWAELALEQQTTLRAAIGLLPEELRIYKNLPTLPQLEAALARTDADEWRDRFG